MKKIIQTIKLRRLKTEFNKEIIEDQNKNEFLVLFRDGTCKDDLIDILRKDHIKPIRYVFSMSDRIVLDRDILINQEEGVLSERK